MFYRMPPISMSEIGFSFMPDYAVLLLCDRIILDKTTFTKLSEKRCGIYGEMAEVVARLNDDGFLRIEDFSSVISDNYDLLDTMLKKDLKILDEWVDALKESLNNWQAFLESVKGPLFDQMKQNRDHAATQATVHIQQMHSHQLSTIIHYAGNKVSGSYMLLEEALQSARKRRKSEYRNELRNILAGYLSQVNANLVLCESLQAGFHDWYDFGPFYREKFIRVGKENAPGQDGIENVKCLFDVSFPEYTFWTPKGLLKALKDKRIKDLRELVDKATQGEIEFDREFATRTLQEVLGVESGLGKFRNYASYVTSPLGFIPGIFSSIQ